MWFFALISFHCRGSRDVRDKTVDGLLLLVGCQDRPDEPTAQQLKAARQLKAAKEAFAKLGAVYQETTSPRTKETIHRFHFPQTTTDADLKTLPNPSFPFALDLSGTQVTDAGLKELKDLNELRTLVLFFTAVTDAGLKELTGLSELTTLGLSDTKVTDAGLKELKDLKRRSR